MPRRSLYQAIPPYLFLHYLFSKGRTMRVAAIIMPALSVACMVATFTILCERAVGRGAKGRFAAFGGHCMWRRGRGSTPGSKHALPGDPRAGVFRPSTPVFADPDA